MMKSNEPDPAFEKKDKQNGAWFFQRLHEWLFNNNFHNKLLKFTPPPVAIKILLLALSAYYFFIFIWLSVFKRLTYPFELEWMEGGVLCQIKRLLEGGALYCAPSETFTPFIYPPFFYYSGGALSLITGNNFFTIRLLSIISTLGTALLIILLLKKRFNVPNLYSIIAGAFFIAAYDVTGTWYDLGRIDSLFIFLLLISVYTLLSENKFLNSVVSAIFLFLAFFTKQVTVVVGLPLVLWVLLFRKGVHRFIFPVLSIGFIIISTLVINYLTSGWYSYYIFDLPSGHQWLKNYFSAFWTEDIFKHAAIAAFFSMYSLLVSLSSKDIKRITFDLFFLGGLLLVSWSGRLHLGGFSNCLIPAYVGLAIFFSRGLYYAVSSVQKKNQLFHLLFLAAAVIQFAYLFYIPYKSIPTELSVQEGKKLLSVLRSFKGAVLMPFHPWYPAMVNKQAFAHSQALVDVYRASDPAEKERVQKSYLQSISEKKYEAVVLDISGDFPFNTEEFKNNYMLIDDTLTTENFAPVTGWGVYPLYLYIRREKH